MPGLLDEIIEKLNGFGDDERRQLLADAALVAPGDIQWTPNPGPQSEALHCNADILLYGGAAGGGKTSLLIGLAATQHKRSIIFRREVAQTDGLEAYGKEVIGDTAQFNSVDREWNWKDGRTLKLAGMKQADDWIKHAGRERDFIGFDEAGEFLEEQVSPLLAWNRGVQGQRCRVVFASNPPRTTDGAWLMEWFAPWLDAKYPNPAVPGELRYGVFLKGSVLWRDDKDDVLVTDGHPQAPLALTFIPASLEDNPERNTSEYRARLQSLREPLRSQLLYGDFSAGLKDAANQCIPAAWVIEAQRRWTEVPPEGVPMCAMGVDASGGGEDPMIIARRYDGWFAELVEIPGRDIPMDRMGPWCAGQVLSYRRDGARVTVDMGGGYGGSMYDHLRHNGVMATSYKGAESTTKRSRQGQFKFCNKRSAAYWLFMEALDPSQPGGSPIALPEDRMLMADLCAPAFEVTPHGIKLEDKAAIVKRLGRSTDRGDAVVMAWFDGPRMSTDALEWMDRRPGMRLHQPRVLMGRPLHRRAS